jgi:two-component system capsular synthesis response regulator RcsB
MFKKIIVAEDIDGLNIGVHETLRTLGIAHIEPVKYCDETLNKINRALLDTVPYDLLITDLSFEQDHRPAILKSGEDLIAAVKKVQPNIKIIVLSVEDRPFRIKTLFDDFGIDALLLKGAIVWKSLKKPFTL